jgi:hypothetical protein
LATLIACIHGAIAEQAESLFVQPQDLEARVRTTIDVAGETR